MKKLLLITAAFLLSGIIFGQALQKGNLLGIHTTQPVLSEGVTMEQYEAFIQSKVIPAYEKNFPGAKCFILKSVRGECKNCVNFLYYFPTEAIRAKYFIEGGYTELGQKGINNMKPLMDELAKMDKSTTDLYTDWLIQ
jgi:hypothetical protein